MAVDKLVDSTQLDADLTSVANAIRTKGGTSASLAFPAGFVSAVNAIPTGGGGYETGTFTPSSRVATATFNTGLSSIHGIAIVPTSETPFKSGGRTLAAFFAIVDPEVFWKVFILPSTTNGSGRQTWVIFDNLTMLSVSGSNVTVTISSPGTNGYFETISYTWIAW